MNDALEAFANAFINAGINPDGLEVSLPLSDWQHLAQTLEFERDAPATATWGGSKSAACAI